MDRKLPEMKRTMNAFVVLGVLSLTLATVEVAAQGPTNGLVAAYSFDEGAGTTVTNVSGNGNTGVISGATWTTEGRFGSALSFDGVNGWVTVNDAASLVLTTGMTLEAGVSHGESHGVENDRGQRGNGH